MQKQLGQLEKRTEKLETRTKMNSQNSSKPPSSDSPFNKHKKKNKKNKRKRGGQKGHKGHKQQMLDPSQIKSVMPDSCRCGHFVLEPNSIRPVAWELCRCFRFWLMLSMPISKIKPRIWNGSLQITNYPPWTFTFLVLLQFSWRKPGKFSM